MPFYKKKDMYDHIENGFQSQSKVCVVLKSEAGKKFQVGHWLICHLEGLVAASRWRIVKKFLSILVAKGFSTL